MRPRLWETAPEKVVDDGGRGRSDPHRCLLLHTSPATLYRYAATRRSRLEYRAGNAYQLANNVWADTGFQVHGTPSKHVKCVPMELELPRDPLWPLYFCGDAARRVIDPNRPCGGKCRNAERGRRSRQHLGAAQERQRRNDVGKPGFRGEFRRGRTNAVASSDHERAAVHQRRQAPRESRRLDAARPTCTRATCAHAAQTVLFLCATDEHGTPAELAAIEAGLDVAEYCRMQHQIQADRRAPLLAVVRSFRPQLVSAEPRADEVLRPAAEENGLIEERTTKPDLSRADGRFLPDRYVIGTCPYCGYERARGDQCENCTRVLDPVDLLSPTIQHLGQPRRRSPREPASCSSSFRPGPGRSASWIQSRQNWPPVTISIALKWLDEGLQDRGHHARSALGHAGRSPGLRTQSLLCLVRCANRVHRRDQRMGRPRSGDRATGGRGGMTPATSPTRSSWRRTTCHSTRLCFPLR